MKPKVASILLGLFISSLCCAQASIQTTFLGVSFYDTVSAARTKLNAQGLSLSYLNSKHNDSFRTYYIDQSVDFAGYIWDSCHLDFYDGYLYRVVFYEDCSSYTSARESLSLFKEMLDEKYGNGYSIGRSVFYQGSAYLKSRIRSITACLATIDEETSRGDYLFLLEYYLSDVQDVLLQLNNDEL